MISKHVRIGQTNLNLVVRLTDIYFSQIRFYGKLVIIKKNAYTHRFYLLFNMIFKIYIYVSISSTIV